MTQNEFFILCSEHNLPPEIALENENLVQALRDRDSEKVKQILNTEF
jgi:hypothetical protein